MEKKHAPERTPPLLIPLSSLAESKNGAAIDDDDRLHHGGPSSPTDHLMSPCSMLLHRKRPVHKAVIRREFSLASEVPKRICPLPHHVPLILASMSPIQKEILEAIHWHFTSVDADFDIDSITCDDFLELPTLVARAKSAAALEKLRSAQNVSECVLLTSHQVTLFQGARRGIPVDAEQAAQFLSSYSRDSFATVSAVHAVHIPSGRSSVEVEISTVHWNFIPDEAVRNAVLRGKVMHTPGAFSLSDPDLFPLIRSVEGSVDSVYGVPVDATVRVLTAVIEEDSTHK